MAYQLIGGILRDDDARFSAGEWRDLVTKFGLTPVTSCEIFDPIIGETCTLRSSRELAALTKRGRQIGVLRWCSRSVGIDVFSAPNLAVQSTRRIAQAIADHLEGEFDGIP